MSVKRVSTSLTERLFILTDAAELFKINDLIPTFKRLGDRGCLPDGFKLDEASKYLARKCSKKVTQGQLPDDCKAVPKVSLFYSCFANRCVWVGCFYPLTYEDTTGAFTDSLLYPRPVGVGVPYSGDTLPQF